MLSSMKSRKGTVDTLKALDFGVQDVRLPSLSFGVCNCLGQSRSLVRPEALVHTSMDAGGGHPDLLTLLVKSQVRAETELV